MLWTDRHAPARTSQMAGNRESVQKAHQWALQFSLGNGARPLLLTGPPGCGKTALAHALAAETGWTVSSFAPPGKDEAERWERQLVGALSGGGLFSSSTLALFENVDDWASVGSRGALSTLAAALKSCRAPAILTARDYYERAIAPVRSLCESIPLRAVNSSDVQAVLGRIGQAEGVHLPASELVQITSAAGGDLRAAINDLQAHNLSASREREKTLMERLRACFKSPTYAAVKGLDLGPVFERNTLKLYVAENLAQEIREPADIAHAMNRLSRADVFDGRIRRRQYWGYLRYSSDLMSWGVASERRHPHASFVPYAYPSYISKMGATKAKRALHKQLAAKISIPTHTTTRTARQFIPLLQAQASAKSKGAGIGPPGEPDGPDSNAPLRPSPEPISPPAALQAYYSFDDEELAGLMGVSPDSLASSKKEPSETKEKTIKKTTTRQKKKN